jgi:hypothetical protein
MHEDHKRESYAAVRERDRQLGQGYLQGAFTRADGCPESCISGGEDGEGEQGERRGEKGGEDDTRIEKKGEGGRADGDGARACVEEVEGE